VVIGALMLIGGMSEAIGAFWCRGWSGFFFHLLSGVFSIVVGALFLRSSVHVLLALTLVLSRFLRVGGLFKIIATLTYHFAAWGWPLLSGLIDFIHGMMIWQEWPASALWVSGLFVGISLLFRGFNWIGLGLSLRSCRRRAGRAAASSACRSRSTR
jgi:uncharacterized membrane protein HdeD (DUF308 family)